MYAERQVKMKELSLTIDTDLARKVLTGFIKSEITRMGFSRALLGLSGGLDSALSCFLAAEALGPGNVLAIRMPYSGSSQASMDDAQKVIDATGVQSMTVEITEMVDPLFTRFPDMSPLRKGNIMARQRMIVLYDQSVAFNGLVIGTGNKTEILLGYSTVYGDAACAINPMGDLYKTQARQLARAMGYRARSSKRHPRLTCGKGRRTKASWGIPMPKLTGCCTD
ncbi:MAG TPA: NAD(+) synthase [Anaerolineaceae bacterium]|nr:NAD(+) synthase [Anaerolineaceae bacterium]